LHEYLVGEKNVSMVTNNLKDSKFHDEEREAKLQLPTNEQEEPLYLVEMSNKALLMDQPVMEGLPMMESSSKQLLNDKPFEEDHMVKLSRKDQTNEVDVHSIIGHVGGDVLLGATKIKELPKLIGANMLSKDVVFIQNDRSLPPSLPQVENKVIVHACECNIHIFIINIDLHSSKDLPMSLNFGNVSWLMNHYVKIFSSSNDFICFALIFFIAFKVDFMK
jgi:hypothetical protein